MLMLGIDTSCDDTSCAVVEDGQKILSSVVSSQTDLHSKYGGVVPEIASRRHVEIIVPVTEEALLQAGVTLSDIDGVSVTHGPGLIAVSYTHLDVYKRQACYLTGRLGSV